jgi:hypothetical protein
MNTHADRRHFGKLVAALGAFFLIGAVLASSRALQSPETPIAHQDGEVPAHTKKVVAAAEKFLQTLDDKLSAKATFAFDSDKRSKWTNLPGPRNGVRMGELSKEQRAAAMDVVAAVTSKEGYEKILDIIAADNVLAKGGKDKGGKDKGKGGGGFGFDNFYLALFGKPSVKEPWLVQFGGHHLGINVTVIGKDFVLTPSLTCTQPSSFDRDGKKIRPLGVESDTAFKLMGVLNDMQRQQAILKPGVNNLVLGPGNDGKDLKPVGLKGADMTDDQRDLLVKLAAAWINILHETSAKPRMEQIKADIKDTYFGWSGPTVVIEYAPQGGTNHIHTVVRELGNDYGKKLLVAKK